MKRPTTFKVTFSERDLPGVFDMLRYDNSNVVAWDRDQDEHWILTLRTELFTPDRWHSFGLYPKETI